MIISKDGGFMCGERTPFKEKKPSGKKERRKQLTGHTDETAEEHKTRKREEAQREK